MSETAGERDARIVEMLARARHCSIYGRRWEDASDATKDSAIYTSRLQLDALRAAGGDVTVPDLPEPTYTLAFTSEEMDLLSIAVGFFSRKENETDFYRAKWLELRARISDAAPDTVTS